MKNTELIKKVNLINDWLQLGYNVQKIGQMHTAIYKHGFNYCWQNYGSSAVKANKKELKFVLTKIFDIDDDFYIIDNNGKFHSTNDLITITGDIEYNFTLYSRNIWTYQEKPLKQYKCTLAEMINTYDEKAELYYNLHNLKSPYFAISSENPFFRYWNFCV